MLSKNSIKFGLKSHINYVLYDRIHNSTFLSVTFAPIQAYSITANKISNPLSPTPLKTAPGGLFALISISIYVLFLLPYLQ